jgi:di/tricarboxylate transporter
VIGVQEAYRAVSRQTVVLIGGLIPLSIAIQDSGSGITGSSA